MKGANTVADSVKCSECGGKLVYEEISQRGKIYSVLPDGTIGKRFKYGDYGGDEFQIVYCKSCGATFDFDLVDHLSRVVINGRAEYGR